jgi:hypothetical protein
MASRTGRAVAPGAAIAPSGATVVAALAGSKTGIELGFLKSSWNRDLPLDKGCLLGYYTY